MEEEIIQELITDNGYLNNNEETEYICLFCSKITKLKNINNMIDFSTLICNYCGVDAMITNTFELNKLEEFSISSFNKSLLDTNLENLMIYDKFLQNKTCRVILYNDSIITTYWVEDLIPRQ